MTNLHKSKTIVWALLIVFCSVWFYALGARVLVPSDEGRYAEMAREMVTTNDWVTPRLNGIKYFEKPPLQTWMNALTFKVFGFGEWQARLWTGLTGLFGIFLIAYTGRRVFNERVGFTAGLVLASCFFWAAASHFNTLDMGLSGMMTLALCGLLLGQREAAPPRTQRNWMLACWAGMALAVLSKGLIGLVLPGAVLVLYTAWTRDWAIWKRLHLRWGLLVFFAITVPWFVLVSLKNPEFPHFFFIHEHFQRFTSKIHHRAGPWYYFIPLLLLGIMPWLFFLGQSLWRARRKSPKGFQPRKMLLVWSGFIFLFFSVSGSKLPSYILPIFPALALLIACYLQIASHKMIQYSAAFFAVTCAIGLAFVPKIAGLTSEPFEMPLYAGYMPWVAAAALLGIAGGVVAMALARTHKGWSVVTLATVGFLSGQILMLGHEPLGRYSSGVNHLAAIQAELTPQVPIYVVGRYEQSLPFYLQRTMTLVAHADEMAFGLKQEPALWIPNIEAFVIVWTADHAKGKKDLAIMRPNIYEDLKKLGVPMRLVGQDPRRVIVTNETSKTNVTNVTKLTSEWKPVP